MKQPSTTSHRLNRMIGPLLAFVFAAAPALEAQSGCINVSGTIVGSFTSKTTVAGTVSGGLAGTVSAVILDIQASGDGALHVQMQHTFNTIGGSELRTMDQAVLSPTAPPEYRMDTLYTITGGTGKFVNATGFLHNHGDINLSTGAVSLRYDGVICGIQQDKADKFVLIVHGTAEELERARTILAGTSPISVETHEVAA